MSPPKIYTRLTRPYASVASYLSLWKASDHLLLVQSNGYSENYQRFRYADIQALLVRKSEFRKLANIVWFSLSAVFLIIAFVSWSTFESVASFAPGAIFAAFGVWNHLLGPTCKVYLATRVKIVTLPIRRKRKAERILAELEPLIRESQSDLVGSPQSLPVEPPLLQ